MGLFDRLDPDTLFGARAWSDRIVSSLLSLVLMFRSRSSPATTTKAAAKSPDPASTPATRRLEEFFELSRRLDQLRLAQGDLYNMFHAKTTNPADFDSAFQEYLEAWKAQGLPMSHFPWQAASRLRTPLFNLSNSLTPTEDKARIQALQEGLRAFVDDLRRSQREKNGLNGLNKQMAEEIWRLREENYSIRVEYMDRLEWQKKLERALKEAQASKPVSLLLQASGVFFLSD
jgi:hypothetical protein